MSLRELVTVASTVGKEGATNDEAGFPSNSVQDHSPWDGFTHILRRASQLNVPRNFLKQMPRAVSPRDVQTGSVEITHNRV